MSSCALFPLCLADCPPFFMGTVAILFSRRFLFLLGNAGACAIAASLKSNRVIESIDFSKNDIGDEGTLCLPRTRRSLFSRAQRQAVVLPFSFSPAFRLLSYLGCSAIAMALQNSPSVTKLDLHSNEIGDEGTVCQTFLPLFSLNYSPPLPPAHASVGSLFLLFLFLSSPSFYYWPGHCFDTR